MNITWKTFALCIGASAFAWAGLSLAEEDNNGRDFQAKLRLRVEYDDNIYGGPGDKRGSAKLETAFEFIYNMNFEHSYVGLRYKPSFVYWVDRPSDHTDLHHQFDVDMNHALSPRSTITAKESFLYADLPELVDNGALIQQKDTYIYNLANVNYDYDIRPNTKAGVGGRYTLLRYDNSSVADNEDYDIYAGGLTLRHQLSMATTLSGEARYESITYSGANRDSVSEYIGAGVDQTFGPDLLGSVRGGYQHKEFSASELGSQSQPYVDLSATILTPSHRTRVTTGVGYSLFEADVFPYANQTRTLLYVSAAHDLTARLSFFLSGSYQNSDYQGDQSVDQAQTSKSGSEQILQGSVRAAYKVNANNWLEANYQYMDVTSDVREDFDRNRVSIGWRTTLR